MPLPFLVAYDQCGFELQTPHMLTSTKRLIASRDVDAKLLGRDALRYHGWDPKAVRARYADLDPAASYELEIVFACEKSMTRVIGIVAGGTDLVPPVALLPGGATTVRAAIPASAIKDRVLDLALECRSGPDAVVSELRLFSSTPVPPVLTVVGDSRGGLIGTVSDADYAGIAGVDVTIAWPGGERHAPTDERGMFRADLRDAVPPGQDAELTISATAGGLIATRTIGTRTLARALRELPPPQSRFDLAGDWQFAPGRLSDPAAPDWGRAPATRVPGHVAFDGLIPDRGVATLRRTISLPATWAGDVVFARFDGVYGRAELFVNGAAAATHSAGATSFDADLTRFLVVGENVLTLVITEYTPHAVLDYMSWYAHTSLLGIWREACLFHVPQLHLGPTGLHADWDVATGSGTLDVTTDIVNVGDQSATYTLELSISDAGRLVHRSTLAGTIAAAGSGRRHTSLAVPDVAPWSAEIPRRYDLDIVLQVAGAGAATYRRKIGFRHVEVVGNRLLVNGAPIRLTGVNRHDARMRSGRSMRTEDLRHDVLAFRHANINVIRTAHYPADPRLLEICDELGMYVQDQMPICFAAGFDDHHWTRTNDAAHLVPYVLEVTAETVARDQAHPSVLIWDLANETQWAWGFDAQLALVREMDPGRPTIFSFDLNQISEVNPLPRLPAGKRPDLRTYHYPGWDRPWREDIDWLDTYDQPVVLDECSPPFQDNARAPLHADILAIDPGMRDYWVTGLQPFVARAMRDKGCIGGMIWSAVDDQWTLPIDESVGLGNWAHLTRLDYYRVRDVHPPQDGRYFRGEGEWGLLDGWGRSRPELWHVHKLYSPIEITSAEFDASASALELTIRNRHAHRALESLELHATGATARCRLVAAPGSTAHLTLSVHPGAPTVGVAFVHPEGWEVDSFTWDVPGRAADPRLAVMAGAEPVAITLTPAGDVSLAGAEPWLTSWPRFHVQDANSPPAPTPLPAVDPSRPAVAADGAITMPLTGNGWDGALTVRASGSAATFDYTCIYSGDQVIDAREIGLAFDMPGNLRDLWWDRAADWSAYPAGHIGRPRGYAMSAPAPANPLQPAGRWEWDTSAAGTNDYRSAKRSVRAAGATDGRRSVTVLSDGTQHVRATLVDGAPVLHVLDWYGGVPFRLDTDHIWTTNFGTGQRIARGTTIQGRVTLTHGKLPDAARRSQRDQGEAEELCR
jgi:hypothetical protein